MTKPPPTEDEAADPRNDDGLYDVRAGARDARNLFAFSILYLALLFATLLGEHLAGVSPLELFPLEFGR